MVLPHSTGLAARPSVWHTVKVETDGGRVSTAVDAWDWLGSPGGETAALMRRVDWAATAVGPVQSWPSSLKALLSMMLSARHPMFLWWGPDLVQFYNDGYVPSFGVGRHPSALGQMGPECWADIWDIIGPEIAGVVATGEATFHEDALVPIFRNGRMEEVYWTYGYSPVFETNGSVAGVLVVVTETTARTVALRRLRTAQILAQKLSGAARPQDMAGAVVEALGAAPEDAPWALVYRSGDLAAGAIALDNLSPGIAETVIACVEEAIKAPPAAQDFWRVVDLAAVPGLPGTPWPEPSTLAIAVPMGDGDTPGPGKLQLVWGLSPRLPYDEGYRDHVRGLVRQLSGAAQRVALVRDLEDASRAKDEFLAMLGHELRNPLSPIVTALEVMRRRGSADSTREQAVIARQVTHMVRLIDDLLEVSRVTRGKIELRRAVAEVARVVTHAVETVAALSAERGHHLEVDLQPGLRWFGDATRLEQVLGNLLTNAARYTQPGGRLRLSVAAEEKELVIRVQDNGEGLDAELLPHLFEPFVQGQRDGDRRGGGLGLGLAVVKGLVALHGGSVKAESAGVGQGSEFIVRMPGLVVGDDDASRDQAARAAGRTVDPGRKRVMVVDDNEDGANLLGELLEEGGYEVAVAFDGPAALRKANTFNPEVALLDLGLPGMDGYQLLGALRQQMSSRGRCRFLALTGYGQPADVERAAAAGFERLMVKPIDIDELERVLNRDAG
jgi:signal transduction histidine kinase/ActR/RegA family two-component response regulator